MNEGAELEKSLIVRGAPQEYVCKQGAWQELPQHLKNRDITKFLLLHGKKSWQVAERFLPDLSGFDVFSHYYGGECSDALKDHFVDWIKETDVDGIVAVGGGKVSDLAKFVGAETFKPVIILPTLAATCAAYTPISVVYRETGEMDRLIIFPQSVALTLLDPQVLLDSPKEYLAAGIGDTLAKWYESDAIISQLDVLPMEVEVARFAARKCRDNLLTDSEKALQAIDEQTLSQAFINVVETNIMLAGMVGGFGDAYGRSSGAHSIHDALTSVPASHGLLHGNKVAYGILVQLAIEGKWDEIDLLLPFYRKLGLPVSLKDMGMTADVIETVAKKASHEDEWIHYMKETITQDVVAKAMRALEKYTV